MTSINWDSETKEDARQYAESKMPVEDWDRKDEILIAVFYNHFIDYIMEELRKSRCWGKYDEWVKENYVLDDWSTNPGAHYFIKINGQVPPFSSSIPEMSVRREYIKINNL